jgi:protein-tyrosine phosphatase
MERLRILFVCAGNICRSPLAEGIFRDLAASAGRTAEFHIDAAGTGGWHQGGNPDRRAIMTAAAHRTDISGQRVRRIKRDDFDRFGLILAMDHAVLETLRATAPDHTAPKLHLFNALALRTDDDIPDPYYGTAEDFETVYAMLFAGCSALLAMAGKLERS